MPACFVSSSTPEVLLLPRWSRDQSAEVVELLDASGLTVVAFAQLHGIGRHRVYRACAYVRSEGVPAVVPSVRFLPVRLPPARSSSLDVHLGAARIPVSSGFDPALLRAVVAALTGESC